MCEASKSKCLLELEQVLSVGDHALTVSRTELTKSDFDTFTLIVEASGDTALANSLFEGTASVRGQQLKCRYDGTIATATLDLLTNQEFGLSHQHQILHFVCAGIEAEEESGDQYEFLVPFGHFGQGDYPTRIDKENGGFQQTFDHIKIQIDGVEWILRHLIELDGVFYPADEAIRVQQEAGIKKFNLNASAHIAIQVKTGAIDRSVAEATVSNICWLLHLAFAQRVAWAELRVRSGRDAKFLCRRAFAFPKKTSGSRPIRNWGDGLIKRFIEGGWPIYQQDPQWWQITLNWYSIACEHATVESSGMILSIMLDRISTRLLKDFQYPKQIGEDLAEVLSIKSRRKDFRAKIQSLIETFASAWDKDRTNALVGKIKEWNDSPPYAKKIAIAYEQVGLRAPSKQLLDKRHKLAHEGSLDLEGQEGVDFYVDLNIELLSMLFAMLGYEGKFFALGRGEQRTSDFLLPEPEAPARDSDPEPNPEPKSGSLGMFLLL